MKVNDGNGLFDNEGMCDQGILIANEAVKHLATGNYIAFCDKMAQIARIFSNLKTAISNDRESLEQKVEDLKRINDALVEEKTGMPVLKECSENGNDNE